MSSFSHVDFLHLDLHKQEQAARSVPYVSFILTHAALVLFLVAAFFVDRLVSTPSMDLPVKILLVCLGVLLVAAEWVYAIVSSRRWKHDVLVLMQLEAAQRQHEAEERMRRQEDMIAAEQLRNRVLQADNQRLRSQRDPNGAAPPVRSIRPVNPPAPAFPDMNRESMSFPPARSIRPVNQPPALPDLHPAPDFPPYPTFEPYRNHSGDKPFDTENQR